MKTRRQKQQATKDTPPPSVPLKEQDVPIDKKVGVGSGCFSTKNNIARELYIISRRTILSPAPAANNESSEVIDIIKPGRKVKI